MTEEVEAAPEEPEPQSLPFRRTGGRARLDQLERTLDSFSTGLRCLQSEIQELREAEARHARRRNEAARRKRG